MLASCPILIRTFSVLFTVLTLEFGGLQAQNVDVNKLSRNGNISDDHRQDNYSTNPISIAVLPFRNPTGDPETATLGDGIADSLINALKSVANLTVTDMEVVAGATAKFANSSSLNRDADALEIGKLLAVQMLVAGSYQRFGNQLRIDARILSVSMNRALPGEVINVTGSYPDSYSALLNQLTVKVTDALRIQLTPNEANRVQETLSSTRSMRARQLYNQGIRQMRNGTQAALFQAIQFFNQALNEDPNYAMGYAAKAEAETRLFEMKQVAGEDTTRLGREAIADATKSVIVAPNIGRGHRALANAHRAVGNYGAASDAAQRAIRVWPNDAGSYLELARALGRGQLKRSAALDRALQLQPGLALMLPELPKVLIVNNSSYSLQVRFVPSDGGYYPAVQVSPKSSRIVALLPSQFQVTAQNSLGTKVNQYTFEAGRDYRLTYDILDESGASFFEFENLGNVAVHVQISGLQSRTLIVDPGQTQSVSLPPGRYTITASSKGVDPTKSVLVLEEGQREIIQYRIVKRPR